MQSPPQLIPAGELVTDPPAVFVTESGNVIRVKVAWKNPPPGGGTHVPVPEHPPDHPVNVDPGDAIAVSVTTSLGPKGATQPVPPPVGQLIPAGLLVTVPVPVPPLAEATTLVTIELMARAASYHSGPPLAELRQTVNVLSGKRRLDM